jgi:Tfp pilus assembly protein PilF
MRRNNPSRTTKSSNPAGNAQPQPSAALTWILPIAVALVTFVTFAPVLHNQFVEWDDDATLSGNDRFRGLTPRHLHWMFTTFHMGHYQPLSWLTFAFDYLLWGLDPFGYHLTNLMLHAANSVVFYVISRQLLGAAFSLSADRPGWPLDLAAALAALLFAVHPLRVESVAWATQRRDVLSGLFYFGTIYCYVRAVSRHQIGSRRWMGAALGLYVLSLLSKATAITLPVVLLLLDVYPLKRLRAPISLNVATRTVWLEKIPFILAAAVFAVLALLAQYQAAALKPLDSHDALSRLGQVFVGTSFYVWKTIVPSGLSPLYEIPLGFSLWNRSVLVSGVAVFGAGLILYLLRKSRPAGLFCCLYYIVVLLPVLGFAQSGPQLVADRYSYLSTLSWTLLTGGLVLEFIRRAPKRRIVRRAAASVAAAAAVIILFAVLSWEQSKVWHDTGTLWRHVVSIYPGSSIAHYNLARFLAKEGEQTEAINHYQEAVRIRPDDTDARNNLALLLAIRGDTDAALAELRFAVEANPTYARGFFNIGRVLAQRGEHERALEYFRQALRLQPDQVEIYLRLGDSLARLGNLEAASMQFEQAVKMDAGNADARIALARVLVALGRKAEAEEHYQNARRILQSPKAPRLGYLKKPDHE